MGMHLGDSIFILVLALVLLGPKKTAELAHHLGKLMAEFRKASNDFKYQFNEEMRVADQQERQRKQETERKAIEAAPQEAEAEHSILSAAQTPASDVAEPEAVPYAISATTGEEHPVDDHPLLRVDVIPPMDGETAAPVPIGETNIHSDAHENAHGAATAATEEQGAATHHGQ